MKTKRPPKHIPPSVKMFGDGIAGIPMFGDKSLLTAEQQEYLKNLETMQKCATLIGNLCFAWSALELGLDKLIRGVMAFPNEDAAETLLANIDARDKIRITLGLGFLRKPSEEWFEILKWCLDQIDSDLRNRRNRFVHDHWHVSSKGITRIARRTGFRKPQARMATEYYTEIAQPTSEKDIQSLIEDVQKMLFRLEFLWLAGTPRGAGWKKLLDEHAPVPPRGPT